MAAGRGTIAIAGALAQRPNAAGHTWVFLQYLLGFRRLGWDVVFIDRLERDMCFDRNGRAVPVERSINLQYLSDCMRRFGLEDSWALLYDESARTFGLPKEALVERVSRSALLVNFMGYLDDPEIRDAAPRRAFVDIDPGFGQLWRELGLHDLFHDHDSYVTIGEGLGDPGCTVPTCGIDWISTKPPVVLDEWPVASSSGVRFTTVATWRGPFASIEHQGRTYGLRAHEFRKFLALPRMTGRAFELALDIDAADHADIERLRDGGWSLVEPRAVAGDPASYRRYIQGSLAEFSVPKNLYVETRAAWFSDRSACYLASGKPVLLRDTGLAAYLPTGKGLVTFDTIDGAASAVREICENYAAHSEAARALAEEHLASDLVLGRLLGAVGVS